MSSAAPEQSFAGKYLNETSGSFLLLFAKMGAAVAEKLE